MSGIKFLVFLFFFASFAQAQVVNTYTSRPIFEFQSGQERECELHWLDDLDLLRDWQQEYQFWRSKYNTYAELLGFGTELDTGDPTLNEYPVNKNLIQEDLDDGKYGGSFIKACNGHVEAAHVTEDQFAFKTWVMRIYTCHARATALGVPCDFQFNSDFPLEFIERLK